MSKLVYRWLLRVYPAQVRIRWEEDMVELFERQLNESWVDAWSCAVAEIFQVALPLSAARDVIALSFISSSVSAVLLFGLIWALGNSVRLLQISHDLFAKFG